MWELGEKEEHGEDLKKEHLMDFGGSLSLPQGSSFLHYFWTEHGNKRPQKGCWETRPHGGEVSVLPTRGKKIHSRQQIGVWQTILLVSGQRQVTLYLQIKFQFQNLKILESDKQKQTSDSWYIPLSLSLSLAHTHTVSLPICLFLSANNSHFPV